MHATFYVRGVSCVKEQRRVFQNRTPLTFEVNVNDILAKPSVTATCECVCVSVCVLHLSVNVAGAAGMSELPLYPIT